VFSTISKMAYPTAIANWVSWRSSVRSAAEIRPPM
jgi:hypothetical protein